MPYLFRNNNYIWHNEINGGFEESFIGPTIAFVFDRNEGKVLKHGAPSTVEKWFGAVQRLVGKSEIRLVGALTMIEGAFPVSEANRCVREFGYINVFHKSISPTMRRIL